MFNARKQKQNMDYIILTDLGIQKAMAIKACKFSISKTFLSYLMVFRDVIHLRDIFLK